MNQPGPERATLLEVGYVGKAHGIKGDVTVAFTTNRLDERARVGAEFATDAKTLEITSVRPYGQRWIVRFKGVSSRNHAEELRGLTLYAAPLEDPDSLFVHELIGSKVLDRAGSQHGTVLSVVSNPAADLLELDSGVLIPLTFVTEHRPGKITVDPPAGLLDDSAEVLEPDKE